MRKLYVRIYFAVLASLAVFALAAGLLWRAFGENGPWSQAYEVAATLAQNALPPVGAPKAEQQAALEKLAANLRADIALFARDRDVVVHSSTTRLPSTSRRNPSSPVTVSS